MVSSVERSDRFRFGRGVIGVVGVEAVDVVVRVDIDRGVIDIGLGVGARNAAEDEAASAATRA